MLESDKKDHTFQVKQWLNFFRNVEIEQKGLHTLKKSGRLGGGAGKEPPRFNQVGLGGGTPPRIRLSLKYIR